MEKEILILHEDNTPFLLLSIKNKFTEHGWKVVESNFKLREIEKLSSLPKLIFGQAEDFNRYADTMVYLADQCIQTGSKLVVLGTPLDIDEFKESVSPSVIISTFVRPIDINIVVESITDAYERLTKTQERKNILVVDDSPVFLRTMMEWLSNKYQVNVAPSAAAAFNFINLNPPDLILLDYDMPICSGGQFLEMIRAEAKTDTIPVMFLTSRDDKETVSQVLKLKPQGYLLKTQSKDSIMNSIEEFFVQQNLKN